MSQEQDESDDLLRFEEYIEKRRGGHWHWVGSASQHHIPIFHYRGRGRSARRVALLLYEGTEVPAEDVVVIRCHDKLCVNPRHLAIVTKRTATLLGNGITARNARKRKCAHGHPLNGDNLYLNNEGHRICRTCGRNKSRRWLHKRMGLVGQRK
jgi:hypothetical protein